MNSKKSEFLAEICKKPMIDYLFDLSEKIGAEKIFTCSCGQEDLEIHISDKPNVTLLREITPDTLSDEGTVIFLQGNAPLLKDEQVKNLLDLHFQSKKSVSIVPGGETFVLMIADSAYLKKTVGKQSVFNDFKKLNCEILDVSADNSFIRVFSRRNLALCEEIINRRNVDRIMDMGVSVTDPKSVYIGSDVVIGRDTVILPGTIIDGKTVIGEDCVIGPDTQLTDMEIGNSTTVIKSVLTSSYVGSGVNIGPFAYMRPNSKAMDNTKIGDFVEIKNAVIGCGTKVAHLTYVGDADVGQNVNFGCGTVVVNYDGKNKHRSTIGNNVFIGCNTNLVSPVTVKDGAFTAAGSTITDEVPENALAIARARQVNKKDWIKPKDR